MNSFSDPSQAFQIIGGTLISYQGKAEELRIPEGVTEIAGGAFWGMNTLQRVIFPDSLTEIGWRAFSGCANLETLIFPPHLRRIGEQAFSGCLRLGKIVIPESLKAIEDFAFLDCVLQEIVFPPEIEADLGRHAFSGCTYIGGQSFRTVTEVRNGVLKGCSGLAPLCRSIPIPEGIHTIGEGAFYGCANLREIRIPASVTRIAESAFYGCRNLQEIHFPEKLEVIEKEAFRDCTGLKRVVLPPGEVRFGDSVFQGCVGLADAAGFLSVKTRLFHYYGKEEQVHIPDGITRVENFAFSGLTGMRSVDLPAGVIRIGDYAFDGCADLQEIRIQDGLIEIGNGSFRGCRNLKTIDFPDGLQRVGERAFLGCRNLLRVRFPDSVQDLEWGIFEDCPGLLSITAPDRFLPAFIAAARREKRTELLLMLLAEQEEKRGTQPRKEGPAAGTREEPLSTMSPESRLAADVLELSRNRLLVAIRTLDAALNRLPLVASTETAGIGTDGFRILYAPPYVLRSYQTERNRIVRELLHLALHCLFRHMFLHTLVEPKSWDLACDIAVEAVIGELALPATFCTGDDEKKKLLKELSNKLGTLTAEKLYRFLLEKEGEEERVQALETAFRGDDHRFWYRQEDRLGATSVAEKTGGDRANEAADPAFMKELSRPADLTLAFQPRPAAEAAWKQLAEQLLLELELQDDRPGTEAGTLVKTLHDLSRKPRSYAEFLRKFAVYGESVKVNEDEFDYIYYTYGLKLYERMPLIEPLEYKEEKKIHDFVIAIDTSGSTSGKLVRRFLEKTFQILTDSGSFFHRTNIHVIQCDTAIQEDRVIRNQEDLEKFQEELTVKGMGGTDFRPVFRYVEQLIDRKEFHDLRGLIYFTDGYGTFPKQKPPYQTAFVFLDEDYREADVPSWAIRLVLKPDEI
ncbi:MAG: leucine-rich repeat protein [Firmicutes bacterium]|nr:leucine-rich repeat protein [Bacillota bacterium]